MDFFTDKSGPYAFLVPFLYSFILSVHVIKKATLSDKKYAHFLNMQVINEDSAVITKTWANARLQVPQPFSFLRENFPISKTSIEHIR